MVEYDRNSKGTPSKEESTHPICIVGVGGAGSNVLDRITMDRTMDAHLVCIHTDVRVLSHAMASTKVQLGADLMRGIGAGGDPDLGREAALFSKELIREELEGHDIIFVCTGLGGGTGSGAAPVIAEIAKSTGALVLVVATMPFTFEGRRRLNQAEEALRQLQKRADALVLFENNRMGELILPKDGIQKAFSQADQLIAQSLRAVSTMISTPGLVKLGLDDLTTALASSEGRCLFGFGEARGQNRGVDALKRALKSPLVDQGRLLHQAENLLVHVAGGESLTLVEVEGVMKALGRHVPDDTQILFGVAVNPKLGDSISVTLISSLGLPQLNAHANAAPPAEMFERPASASKEEEDEPAPAPKREPAPKPVSTPAPVAAEEAKPVIEAKAPAKQPEPELVPQKPAVATASKPKAEELFPDEVIDESEGESDVNVLEEPLLFPEDEEVVASEPSKTKASVSHSASQPTAPEPVGVAVSQPEEPNEVPESASAGMVEDDVEFSGDVEDEFEDASVSHQPSTSPQASLASVVARSGGTAAENTKRRTDSQQTFSLGGEDRGRFKDTDQLVVEGEDLDVPTWMRLRKKLKR